MQNVEFGLISGEWLEPIDLRQTLPELSHTIAAQFVTEFRLSRKNNLKQLGVGRFKIGQ